MPNYDGDIIKLFTKQFNVSYVVKNKNKNKNVSLSTMQIKMIQKFQDNVKWLWAPEIDWDMRRFIYLVYQTYDKNFQTLEKYEDRETLLTQLMLINAFKINFKNDWDDITQYSKQNFPKLDILEKWYNKKYKDIEDNFLSASTEKCSFSHDDKLVDSAYKFYLNNSDFLKNLGPSEQLHQYIDYIKSNSNSKKYLTKKTLILHIGMNKTGSSSIQSSFHKNFNNDKIHYFDLNNANHSVAVEKAFKIKDMSPDMIEERQQIKNMIVKQIEESDAETFILSGEDISKLAIPDLKNLKQFFSSLGFIFTIIGYVRPPKSFVESSFQQRLKGKWGRFDLLAITPKYKERFSKFDDIFGSSNVHLQKFDPKSFLKNDVMIDFCFRLGIPFKDEDSVRVNESLSKEGVALLFVYRKYGQNSDYRTTYAFIQALGRIGTNKLKFSPDLIFPVLEKNKQDIEWMENRLGYSLLEPLKYQNNDIKSEEELEEVAIDALDELNAILTYPCNLDELKGNIIEKVVYVMNKLQLEIMERKST